MLFRFVLLWKTVLILLTVLFRGRTVFHACSSVVLPMTGNMVIYPIALRFVILVFQLTLEKPEFLATLKAHKSKSNRINYRVRRGTVHL